MASVSPPRSGAILVFGVSNAPTLRYPQTGNYHFLLAPASFFIPTSSPRPFHQNRTFAPILFHTLGKTHWFSSPYHIINLLKINLDLAHPGVFTRH